MALEPVMPTASDDEFPELRDFSRRFWWTLPLTLVVLGLAMLGHRTTFLNPDLRSWVELVLSLDVIVSLTLLGQILELKARSSTSAAIKALLCLALPATRDAHERE